jgi:hypothetical protein
VFADVFGIRPWEWELLTGPEALQLMAYIDRQGGGSGNF